MKYLIVVDDNFLSNFRLDDYGLTLVVNDKADCTRAMPLKPIKTPTITFQTGDTLYLTQGHIDALLEYEQQQSLAEAVRRINESISRINKACDNTQKIEPIAVGQGCFKCPSHATCYDAFQIHSHHCNHYDKTEEEFKAWLKNGRD